ncbi:MAG: hypothetical protein ACE15D_09765 [Candidatus Eisenbacteria bacterium]
MRFSHPLPAAALVLLLVSTSYGGPLWLDDTLIAPTALGTDRVVVDVKEDNTAWYAYISGNHVHDQDAWYTSSDDGATWSSLYRQEWLVDDVAVGGAYGFDVLLNVWQPYGSLVWCRVLDAETGAALWQSYFTSEYPLDAREIVVDANTESGPAEVFIACASFVNVDNDQVMLKAYRSTDLGETWDRSILDQGPTYQPDYIGDIDLRFAFNGYPYFHVVYVKHGRIWHVRTTDAGVHWENAQELIVNVRPTSEVSVAFNGVYGYAVGESETGQIVCCSSSDAGATWSNAALVDGAEASPRLPSISDGFGLPTVVYRKGDGRLAVRSHTGGGRTGWGDEQYATFGTTNRPISTRMSSYPDGNVGVVFARPEEDGRPYFASLHGEPSDVGDPALPVATGRLTAWPTPTSGEVTILLPRGANASVGSNLAEASIFSVTGKLISRLDAGAASQPSIVCWDGRDLDERPAAPGMYYLRLRTTAGWRTAPIVVVR